MGCPCSRCATTSTWGALATKVVWGCTLCYYSVSLNRLEVRAPDPHNSTAFQTTQRRVLSMNIKVYLVVFIANKFVLIS